MRLLSKIMVTGMVAVAPATAFAQAGVSFDPLIADSMNSERLTIKQLRAKYQDEQSRYMNIGDVEVHYKDEGQGPVVLLVHGSLSTMRTWDGVAEKLTDRYRVIRFDLPGFGLSGRISDKAVAEMQPTDIPQILLERLGVTKVAAASGVSSGGTMVAMLAAKNPGLVERLILSNMPSDPVRTDHMKPPPELTAELEKARETGFQAPSYWKEFFNFYFGVPARATPELQREYYDFNRRVPEKHPIAFIAQVKDGKETTPLFASLTIPVLLVWGSTDPLLPDAAAHRLAEYLEQAKISKLFMPDVGHYPPLEIPGRFGKIIGNYLEAVTPILEPAE
ncbi:alpha/beta hydrolase [Parasphingorhabdus sp.]|uniref:alpha/beta fold hydrolase n=1 Tax=Parasphingorhabdus sp. TaxID=2709688 RepID=UPI002F95CF15